MRRQSCCLFSAESAEPKIHPKCPQKAVGRAGGREGSRARQGGCDPGCRACCTLDGFECMLQICGLAGVWDAMQGHSATRAPTLPAHPPTRATQDVHQQRWPRQAAGGRGVLGVRFGASQSVSVSHLLTRSACAVRAAVWRGLDHWIRSCGWCSEVWTGDIPRLDTQHPLAMSGARSN